MKTVHTYVVAQHRMDIVLAPGMDVNTLLPSFTPFVVSTDTPTGASTDVPTSPLFTMDVEQGEAPSFAGWTEVGQFDCGGANHGVYLDGDGGYGFEISMPALEGRGTMTCVLLTDHDFAHGHAILLTQDTGEQHFGLNNALMMAYAFASATQGTLLIHASVIRKDGYGYLFTAPSGTGKSTHTYLWYKNIPGCDLMNDDNPVVRVVDGETRIYGSPWSGKTPCYRNIWAPVGAITRLEQKPCNTIRRMDPIEGFSTLISAVSSMKWDERVYLGICTTIEAILPTTPLYLLGCRPDAEAARVCYEEVRRV